MLCVCHDARNDGMHTQSPSSHKPARMPTVCARVRARAACAYTTKNAYISALLFARSRVEMFYTNTLEICLEPLSILFLLNASGARVTCVTLAQETGTFSMHISFVSRSFSHFTGQATALWLDLGLGLSLCVCVRTCERVCICAFVTSGLSK